jgi:hypothetical protein
MTQSYDEQACSSRRRIATINSANVASVMLRRTE